jgi:GNAT superfamily N-acetyltransferase
MSEPPAARLRPIAAADVPEIVPLLAQLGYEMSFEEAVRRVAEVQRNPDHHLIVAELVGRIVGVMHVFDRPAIENPREAVVQAIVVDESCRRVGVGHMLMAEAERWGIEHHCCSVALSSNVARTPAHAFYQAIGYRVAATSLVLRKPLAPANPAFVAGLGPAIHETEL